jgi:hypothetical protein
MIQYTIPSGSRLPTAHPAYPAGLHWPVKQEHSHTLPHLGSLRILQVIYDSNETTFRKTRDTIDGWRFPHEMQGVGKRMRKLWSRIPRPGIAPGLLAVSGCVLMGVLLTGCGTTVAASKSIGATATPTCPPVIPTRSISGTIQAIFSSYFTVATGSGGAATMHFSSTTRFTRQVRTTAAALTAGMAAQIITDSSGVIALRVVVTGTPGSRSSGFGGIRGTPVARGNANCFRRGAGTGFGQGAGSSTGIRGTLTVVSSSQLVLSDSQGQSYTVAMTSSTVIISITSAQSGDLRVGDTVTAAGTTTSDGINARTVMIQLPTS